MVANKYLCIHPILLWQQLHPGGADEVKKMWVNPKSL